MMKQTTDDSPTVLVIEDEPIIREMVALILEQEGFRVLQAEDSQQAEGMWESERDRIDVLLTDVEIPGVLGPELAQQFKQEKPTLAVIIATGSGEISDASAIHLHFEYEELPKPYTPRKLIQAVTRAFGRVLNR